MINLQTYKPWPASWFLFFAMVCITPAAVVRIGTEIPAATKLTASMDILEKIDWLVVGPIHFDLNLEDPKIGGLDDGKRMRFSEAFLQKLLADASRVSDGMPLSTDDGIRRRLAVKAATINCYKTLRIFEPHEKVNDYFFGIAEIECDKPSQYCALIGNDEGIDVWLNGKLIGQTNDTNDVATPNYVLPMDLNKGVNEVIIRVKNTTRKSGFSFQIAPNVPAAIKLALATGSVIQKPVCSATAGMAIRIATAIKDLRLAIDVRNEVNETVFANDDMQNGCTLKLAEVLSPDVYVVTVKCAGETYTQSIIVGDVDLVAKQLAGRTEHCPGNPPDGAKINLDTIRRRMEILLNAPNRMEDDRGWQRKVAYTLSEWRSCLSAMEAGRNVFKGVVGLHLRGFRSQIDGQIQHYRVFVPAAYDPLKKALPLFIVFPTVTSASRPFIESAFVADHAGAMMLARYAERMNAGIVWIGYRGMPIGSPCEATHLDEVLGEVNRDYRIDRQRIVLVATCSGAIPAEMAAIEFPKRFAGLAILDGEFNGRMPLTETASCFLDSMEYRMWTSRSGSARTALARSDIPVYVVHDGDRDPGHGEIETTLRFLRLADSMKRDVTFCDLTEAKFFSTWESWETMFEWGSGQTNKDVDEKRIVPISPDDQAWPVARVFAGKFTLVEGTHGSESENAAIREIGASLQEAWHARYYQSCKIQTDEAYLSETKEDGNVVLIGNAATNRVWGAIDAKIPVKLSQTSVELFGEEWQGSNLSVQVACDYPGVPDRLVLLVGAWDIKQSHFGTFDLSADGWFRFAVWTENDGAAQLVFADR
jgi:hypothetical protein